MSTGLRSSEVLSLTWGQINGDEVSFEPEESKNGRHDVCVMDDEVLGIIMRRHGEAVCEYVFPRNSRRIRGDVFHHTMCSPVRRRTGLARHVQFHDRRRTLGKRILDATGNSVLPQHQLRHADLRTTQKLYAKKPMDLMRQVVRDAKKETTTARQ